jgi:Methyltransferase domain
MTASGGARYRWGVNCVELYQLGQRLMLIATEAMSVDAPLRRVKPGPRVVLEDALQNPDTTVDEIAQRTGLQQSQVSALVQELSGDRLLKDGGDRIEVSHKEVLRGNTRLTIDEPLAAALRTDDAGQEASLLESLARRLGMETVPCPDTDFNESYGRRTPPWEIGRPQPALAELAEEGAFRGRVLDVGCGTGEHALLAAGLGLAATGVDTASAAIEIARQKATERDLQATFAVHDALDLGTLGGQFDTVIDSALFHAIGGTDRARYESSLRQAIAPGGRYFMLCFADGKRGSRGVSRAEIEATFGNGWRIDAIDPAKLEMSTGRAGAAWRAAITRL